MNLGQTSVWNHDKCWKLVISFVLTSFLIFQKASPSLINLFTARYFLVALRLHYIPSRASCCQVMGGLSKRLRIIRLGLFSSPNGSLDHDTKRHQQTSPISCFPGLLPRGECLTNFSLPCVLTPQMTKFPLGYVPIAMFLKLLSVQQAQEHACRGLVLQSSTCFCGQYLTFWEGSRLSRYTAVAGHKRWTVGNCPYCRQRQLVNTPPKSLKSHYLCIGGALRMLFKQKP